MMSMLADAAYTLAVGRRAFKHREFVVASSAAEAAELLQMHRTAIYRLVKRLGIPVPAGEEE